jgi:hypothetical protein
VAKPPHWGWLCHPMAGKKNKKIKSFCRPTPMTKNNNNNKKMIKFQGFWPLGLAEPPPRTKSLQFLFFIFYFFVMGVAEPPFSFSFSIFLIYIYFKNFRINV